MKKFLLVAASVYAITININGQNVGIGTTIPLAKLEVSGSETSASGRNAAITIVNTASTNTWTLRTGAAGTSTPNGGFSIADNTGYRLTITNSGNVGIGTTGPQKPLSVVGGAVIDQTGLNNGTTANMLSFGSFSGEGIGSNRNGGNHYGLDFYTGGTNRMAITSSGYVGIGTIAPNQMLAVAAGMNIDQDDANSGTVTNSLRFGNNSSGEAIGSRRTAGANQWGLDFYTSSANRMSITLGGYVGIGLTNPDSKLTVSGAEITTHGKNAGITIKNSSSSNSWTLRAGATGTATPDGGFSIGDNSAYRLIITNAGDVAIGTLTPASGYKLSVDGKIIAEEIKVQNSIVWPDYVFEKNYALRTIPEFENFISSHKHLPGIPSAEEMKNGQSLGDMQRRMIEKIEELSLYIIQLYKQNEELTNELSNIKANLRQKK